MLYIDDGKLQAAEVLVTVRECVENLVKDGWRILGVCDSTVPSEAEHSPISWIGNNGGNGNGTVSIPGVPISTPLFIMGRDMAEATLHKRLSNAEKALADAVKAAEEAAGKMETVVDREEELLARTSAAAVRATEAQNDATKQSDRFMLLREEVGKIRVEIGEARWRELLGSLAVEQVLAGAGSGDDGNDVPF